MSEIRVDPQFLINLASRVRRVANDLQQYATYGGTNLSSAPPVSDAYNSLDKDWNFNRDKLVKELDALAAGFDAAQQALVEADRDTANQLRDG